MARESEHPATALQSVQGHSERASSVGHRAICGRRGARPKQVDPKRVEAPGEKEDATAPARDMAPGAIDEFASEREIAIGRDPFARLYGSAAFDISGRGRGL